MLSQCAARKVFQGVFAPRSGGRLDAVVRENCLDRVAGNVVADGLQSATDPRVPPRRIFGRHAHDERGDVRLRARTTRALRLRTVVLLGDEPAIPPQDRVRSHDSGNRRESAPAKHFAFHGETAALVVGEAPSAGWLRRPKNSVLLEQVLDDRLLLAIDPTGKQQTEERERRRQRVDGGSVPTRCAASRTMSFRPNFRRHAPSSGCVNPPMIGGSGVRRSFRTRRGRSNRSPRQGCRQEQQPLMRVSCGSSGLRSVTDGGHFSTHHVREPVERRHQ